MPQLNLLGYPRRCHVVIMRKSWGLLPKILTGEKKLESRWYQSRYWPWGRVNVGDELYFKNSGEPVTVKATVLQVLTFEDLTPGKVREILQKYGKADGLGIETGDFEKFYALFKDKKYCLLIFLKDATKIEPFHVNKTGFGAMSSWLTFESAEDLEERKLTWYSQADKSSRASKQNAIA